MAGNACSQVGRPRKYTMGGWNSMKNASISPIRCSPNVKGGFKTSK